MPHCRLTLVKQQTCHDSLKHLQRHAHEHKLYMPYTSIIKQRAAGNESYWLPDD